MNKIAEAFQNGKAYIPFITCGDPDLETTAKIIGEMSRKDVYKRQVQVAAKKGSKKQTTAAKHGGALE